MRFFFVCVLLVSLFVVLSGFQGGFFGCFWVSWQKKSAWVNLHLCLNDIDVQRDVHICSSIIIVVSFTETPSITDSSAFKGTWSGGT